MFSLLAILVLLTSAAAAVAAACSGLAVEGAEQAAALTAALAGLAWFRPHFRMCLSALAALVGFSAAFSVLLYALAASSPWPLADDALGSMDAALGIDAREIARWTAGYGGVSRLMFFVYFSAIPQTIVLIMWLGLRRDERLVRFLVRFMVCGLVTAVGFYMAPALGTAGVETAPWNAAAARDLLALRSGAIQTIDVQAVEGIVTFPSFHTVWALLLILAAPTPPVILLNALMILSTVTTGAHFAIDVIAGALVCYIGVAWADRLIDFATSSPPAHAAGSLRLQIPSLLEGRPQDPEIRGAGEGNR